HWNEEAGGLWMQRLLNVYPKAIWLNPVKQQWWGHTVSIDIIRHLLDDRMYPMTLEGLDQAMRELSR
ncbi:MAG: VWA domain-containing protein, partial [Rhodospirillales bacterium]|nr:VWA domain-containing protein [Rhodospirillales bacterium]